jgi:two-component system, chemotaxis family, protein-glutamate methylesterase/glutaminase
VNEVKKIVVVGTSIGGFEALKELLSKLSPDMPAVILIVQHTGAHETFLATRLLEYSRLPVRMAFDHEPLSSGSILIAPPDRHLLVEKGRVRLSHGPKENFSRPAIDPLFRSAALAYGPKVIGVILTGDLDDGVVGLQAVKACGGKVIVQDPSTAASPSMPRNALDFVDVDCCTPLTEMAAAVMQMVEDPPLSGALKVPDGISIEEKFMTNEGAGMEDLKQIAAPTTFTCPECSGSLWRIGNGEPERYRCHTGHAFTALSLVGAQEKSVEEAIWGAVRALHEKEALLMRMAKTALKNEHVENANELRASALRTRQNSEILRKIAIV